MAEIKSYRKRLQALNSEFDSFLPVYKELSDYHLANSGRFLVSDRNKGFKRNTKQINNTSRLAVRTAASGLHAGMTSPSRPWFRLSSGDAGLDNVAAVKSWLFDVQTIMYNVFSKSNFYNSVHSNYSELVVFGVGAIGVYEDFENVIHCQPYTIGSYRLATNGKNEVDVFYREYDITVSQCISQFGYDKCSNSVQDQFNKGNTENWVTIVHVIEPNDKRDSISPLARDKRFRAVYFENTAGNNATSFLRESGHDEFPIMTPRWDVIGEDVYATDCPGMTALGDTKALQLAERRMYQAIDKVVSPPLQGPAGMRNKLPNGTPRNDEIIWTDNATDKLSSIYEFRPDLNAIGAVIDKVEYRIKKSFYEDLFLMLSDTDRREITAREVAEKHEEKLLALGPVLERLNTELLDPVINRVFNILQRNGVLPLPPEELRNKELNVEYVSVLAQAQRMVSTGSVERVAQFAAGLATIWPDSRHKIDAAQAIDDYAESIGINPAIIRSDDIVAQMVAQEQQQAQQAQMMAMAQQAAETAKATGEASIKDDNVLGQVARKMGAVQ